MNISLDALGISPDSTAAKPRQAERYTTDAVRTLIAVTRADRQTLADRLLDAARDVWPSGVPVHVPLACASEKARPENHRADPK